VVRIEQPGDDAQGRFGAQAYAQRLNGVPLINCRLPGLVRKPWISSLSDYLVKPISRRKLLDALRRLGREFSRVLIVEDEPAMREFLSLCISSAYPRSAIRAAGSGAHALLFARELSPDLILLDLTLPDADGLELAEQLHQINQEQACIVAVTAHDYPAEQGRQELDEISCSRAGRFSQRELDRVLNALLEAISPGGAPAGSGPAAQDG
jgi:CheY-like chemotaxis protein